MSATTTPEGPTRENLPCSVHDSPPCGASNRTPDTGSPSCTASRPLERCLLASPGREGRFRVGKDGITASTLLALVLIGWSLETVDTVRLGEDGSGEEADLILRYDDASAYWITWGGTYRGVWFHVEDSTPGEIAVDTPWFMFYQHTSYP